MYSYVVSYVSEYLHTHTYKNMYYAIGLSKHESTFSFLKVYWPTAIL